MNIDEVAKLTELSPRQIREYEKLGLLQTIQRTDSGYRVFSDTQLQRLKFIKHARDVGFSLAQIEALLALQDNKQRSNAQVKALTRCGEANRSRTVFMRVSSSSVMRTGRNGS